MAQQPGRMNWSRKAAAWVGLKALGFATNHTLTDHDAIDRVTGLGSASGVRVNDETAMRVSTVWSCVRVLAETIGSLPLAVYEKDSRGNAVKVDHPLSEILVGSPNANMTSQEMREAQMVNLCMAGNGYSLLEHGSGGRLISATPVPSPQVMPERTPTGAVVYAFTDRGKREVLPAEKVWHLKGFGGTGLIGLSPLGYARQAMGLALATEEFGSRFFKEGAKTSGIVRAKDWLTDPQREKARKNLEAMWHGMANAHRVQLLEGGMEYLNVTMPLEDAQFLQTRKFQINEICRVYRVPPHMVADLERATFSNIEQQSQDFVQFTLLPYFRRYEETFTKRLLPAGQRGRFFLRFNFEGLLRADSSARAALYSVLLQNGVYSRNEARALENMPRSNAAGMDDHTVQSNMALIQFLEAMGRSQSGAAA